MNDHWVGELSRLQAIKILNSATARGYVDWDGLVEDFYDEESDTWPTIYHVFLAIGVSEKEYKAATGEKNPNWPAVVAPSAEDESSAIRWVKVPRRLGDNEEMRHRLLPLHSREEQDKLWAEVLACAPKCNKGAGWPAQPRRNGVEWVEVPERLGDNVRMRNRVLPTGTRQEQDDAWAELLEAGPVFGVSGIGESLVLQTVRDTLTEAAANAFENGDWDASKDVERLLELVEEAVRDIAPAVNGLPADEPSPVEFVEALKALESLQRELLPSWEGGAATKVRSVLLRERQRVEELESICAAMLSRWSVIHNLVQAAGSSEHKEKPVYAVASLSAMEFVTDGGRSGGERLLRQEGAARTLLKVEKYLDLTSPDSELHQEVQQAARKLASYPQLSPEAVVISVDQSPDRFEAEFERWEAEK
ncbi:hypothetical protein ACJJJB_00120 (plasmid) [Microbulbifer sp. ANSA001]|uniref:hypothetical protein n=1 Tax=Microbulbifer sp. ANSA001 TaxID=3243358 RepID=UPI00404257FC